MKKSSAGFSLVELLVVVAIVTIISAIILANNNKYGARVQLQNLVYDIALSVRQAQSYGISVKGNSTGFNVGYGVHFNKSTSPTSYVIFADSNGNGAYDGPLSATPDQIIQTMTLAPGFTIQANCMPQGTQAACTGVNNLDIIFIRPEPDAIINPTSCTVSASGNESCTGGGVDARIVIRPPKVNSSADFRSVVVTSSGTITVQ